MPSSFIEDLFQELSCDSAIKDDKKGFNTSIVVIAICSDLRQGKRP